MKRANDHNELVRLDRFLVAEGLVPSRHRAEMLIREHGVKVNGKLVRKTGKKISENDTIELVKEDFPWVSRAAFKLIEAIDHWNIRPTNYICIDVGASTGGFTQVLVERGARKVYAVDTGKDQLHKSVKKHKQVVSRESTNILDFKVQEEADLIVVDVSFVSLDKILPALGAFTESGGKMITLFKPQFEVGKEGVGKNGIVKDQSLINNSCERVKRTAKEHGFKFIEMIPSPIKGGDGNQEYLIYWKKQ